MPLGKVAKVVVQFSPWSESRAIREFLSRITSKRTHACNPDCKIEFRLRTKGAAKVLIEYSDKQRTLISPAGLTAGEIIDKITSRSQDEANRGLLKKTGLEGTRLETHWGLSGVHNAGTGQKVPIT